MSIGTPWIGTRVNGDTGTPTSATVDISGAADGDWVYVDLCIGATQTLPLTPPSGWTLVSEGNEQTNSYTGRFRRKKVTGDTTFIFNFVTGSKFTALPFSYPGVDGTTPDEGAAYLAHTANNANFVTASITPTAADRWIVGGFHAKSTTALRTFTPDAAMVERSDGGDTGNPENAHELADTNGAVTAAAHTYTAVCSASESHGGVIVMAIIPASTATDLTVGNATQTQTSENLSLVQDHSLVVQSSAQSQTADNAALIQDHQLVSNAAAQAQSVDNVILTQVHFLQVDNAVQAQSVDNISLTQLHLLSIANALQAQTSTHVDLSNITETALVGAITAQGSRAGNVVYAPVALSGTIE